MNTSVTKNLTILLIVAILFIIWGIIGIVDSKNDTYEGYATDGNYSIIKVETESPAEKAGMMKGDIMKTYDGIPVSDNKGFSKRDRERIGEEIEIVVERDGEVKALKMTYESVPSKDKILNLIAFITGVMFVALGIYSHKKVSSSLSLLYAVFAVCFGYNFLAGPSFNNELIVKIIASFTNSVVLLSFAVLTNFVLSYPPKSNFLNQRSKYLWIYAPALCVLIFFWIIIFIQPDGTSSFNQFISILVGVLIVGYFGVPLIVLIVKYAKASSDMRKQSGLNLMLLGTIIGLAPILIIIILETVSPKTVLPGSDYVILTMMVIPIFFTMAILKQDKSVVAE